MHAPALLASSAQQSTSNTSAHDHAVLLQVERSNEDSVRLKILQTALTLMQNPAYADDEVSM
jgi:hypothetical protein